MADEQHRPDHQTGDPWGLPPGNAAATWPEQEAEPEEGAPAPTEEEAVGEPEAAEGQVTPVEAEEPEAEEEPAAEAPPRPVEEAEAEEPQAPPWADQEPEAEEGEEPTIRPVGPLSQALAAARSVISSLQEPREEGSEDRAEPESAEGGRPEEEAGPAEEQALELPEEPPPWMEEAPPEELTVEETEVREISVEVPEGAEAEEVLEEVAAHTFEEEPVRPPEEVIALGEEEYSPEETVETVIEEEVVIEVEGEEEDLERLASRLAEHGEGEGEVEVEPEEGVIRMEKVVEEADEEGHSPQAEEPIPEVDTTPSAYAALASMAGDLEEEAEESEEPGPEPEPEEAGDEELETGEPARSPAAEGVQAGAPAVEWGSLWAQSAQGWVEDEDGTPTWRPIVTTTASVSDWEVDTYLGVVAGQALLAAPPEPGAGSRGLMGSSGEDYERELELSRGAALRAMVETAVARGAHAVIGVSLDHTTVGGGLLVSASGTAVTLKSRG